MNTGENNQKLGGERIWWEPAVAVFGEITTWIAAPIILALIAGKALDKHYGTKPTWLLIFVALAFLISSYGILQSVRGYVKKLKEKIPTVKNKEDIR